MSNIAADALYEVSYRSSWGAGDDTLGHVVIRRLDDHEVVAEFPARTEKEARELVARAEAEIRGSAGAFESAWGIGSGVAADPGPDVLRASVAGERGVRDQRAEPDRGPSPGERVIGPDPRLTVLPGPGDVFAADQMWLERLLHPLVSVELGAIDPAWSGRVHLLSPVEPVEGLLGGDTVEHHDEFACENWISFRVEPDGHYRYLGQRELFALEAGEGAESAGADEPVELREFYAEAEAEFAAARVRWERLDKLVWGDEEDPTRPREGWDTDIAILDQLGGEPGYGNWTSFPPPAAFRLDESDPLTPVLRLVDGRPFAFVGCTAGYPWREQGADGILLFFEPETRTAVLTFDWT